MSGAAERRRLPGDVHIVLDGDRNAEQGRSCARGAQAIRFGGLGECGVAAHQAEGIEGGLALVDPVE